MKIGVTGTRSGMNGIQKAFVTEILSKIIAVHPVSELHHGDCVGVDAEVADCAKILGYHVICHPPSKDELRAFHDSDVMLAPASYFARNRNIVNMVDRLLVVPYQDEPQKSGGTWYTYSYANKVGKPVTVIYPKRS